MKIAILSFYGGHMERGVENWTYELASRLTEKHEVIVFQNGPARKDASYRIVSSNIGVNWKERDSRGTLLRILFIDYWSILIAKFVLKILPVILKEQFDIIIPTNGGWQPAIVRLATWAGGRKMVSVGHSGRGWDERNNLWNFPDVFVSLTKEGASWAKRVNPLVKVVNIANGIDLKTFSIDGPKAILKMERPIILAVGAPERGKRLDLLIKALSRLRCGSLIILGSGYEEEKIRTLGDKLLGKRFMMKKVHYDEIPKYYRTADIFTLPSWAHEAFGMVYLEAMASGLPVVANNDPIRREIVGDAGILVDPTDTDAYAKALEKALKTNWGDKPRKQAEKFSWDKIAKAYENLFNKIV